MTRRLLLHPRIRSVLRRPRPSRCRHSPLPWTVLERHHQRCRRRLPDHLWRAARVVRQQHRRCRGRRRADARFSGRPLKAGFARARSRRSWPTSSSAARFPKNRGFRPYLSGGIGMLKYDLTRSTGVEASKTDFGYNVGVGASVLFSRHVGAEMDVRYFRNTATSPSVGWTSRRTSSSTPGGRVGWSCDSDLQSSAQVPS